MESCKSDSASTSIFKARVRARVISWIPKGPPSPEGLRYAGQRAKRRPAVGANTQSSHAQTPVLSANIEYPSSTNWMSISISASCILRKILRWGYLSTSTTTKHGADADTDAALIGFPAHEVQGYIAAVAALLGPNFLQPLAPSCETTASSEDPHPPTVR
jgi:hypothetical protein